MTPTSGRLLLSLSAVGAVGGWALANWIDRMGGLIALPWLAPATVWLFAATVAYWAWHTRARLRPPAERARLDQHGARQVSAPAEPARPRMDPLVAARTAALALAGSRTGAVVGGAYGGIAVRLLDELAIAAGRGRFLIALLAALGSVALVLASLWLEHICRIPEDPPT